MAQSIRITGVFALGPISFQLKFPICWTMRSMPEISTSWIFVHRQWLSNANCLTNVPKRFSTLSALWRFRSLPNFARYWNWDLFHIAWRPNLESFSDKALVQTTLCVAFKVVDPKFSEIPAVSPTSEDFVSIFGFECYTGCSKMGRVVYRGNGWNSALDEDWDFIGVGKLMLLMQCYPKHCCGLPTGLKEKHFSQNIQHDELWKSTTPRLYKVTHFVYSWSIACYASMKCFCTRKRAKFVLQGRLCIARGEWVAKDTTTINLPQWPQTIWSPTRSSEMVSWHLKVLHFQLQLQLFPKISVFPNSNPIWSPYQTHQVCLLCAKNLLRVSRDMAFAPCKSCSKWETAITMMQQPFLENSNGLHCRFAKCLVAHLEVALLRMRCLLLCSVFCSSVLLFFCSLCAILILIKIMTHRCHPSWALPLQMLYIPVICVPPRAHAQKAAGVIEWVCASFTDNCTVCKLASTKPAPMSGVGRGVVELNWNSSCLVFGKASESSMFTFSTYNTSDSVCFIWLRCLRLLVEEYNKQPSGVQKRLQLRHVVAHAHFVSCLLYTSPSPRD